VEEIGDEHFNMAMGHDGDSIGATITIRESGGVGCSSGLIDLSVSRSLCSRLSGIAMCRGDSCRFPVAGEGCDSFQDGPSS